MTENLPANTLWLIDDDPALRLILEDTFADAGLKVVVFANAKGAWARLNDVLGGHEDQAVLPDAILTDIRMPMMDGLSFSEWVHDKFPELPIVIMTAHSDLKSAVDSYQTGAFEYLPKPFDLDDAVAVIRKAIKGSSMTKSDAKQTATDDDAQQTMDSSSRGGVNAQHPASIDGNHVIANKNHKHPATQRETAKTNKKRSPTKSSNANAHSSTHLQPEKTHIIGQSVAMQTVFRAIGRLAASPITVLITGESGTGKELVAGALHEHSPRADKPFIALNMAAIPHDLIESELFGHEKGAFTGATAARQGRFEQANGGTLFLDEIGDMPFSTQTRLLRVLANGEFFRVGGQKPIHVDVRIVAATHQNLEQLVKEGKFREDLFYRLNVIRLPLPPLRQRREDIPELVNFFMHRSAKEMNTDEKRLSASAMQLMQAFDWLGNVRQLENACRWITVMATGDEVLIEDLPPELLAFAHKVASQNTELNHLSTNNTALNEPSHLTMQTSRLAEPDVTFDRGSFGNSPAPSGVVNSDSHPYPANPPTNSLTNSTAYPHAESQQESISPNRWQRQAHHDNQLPQTPYHTNATHFANVANNWQHQLQTWADRALDAGKTDILQQATPEFERVLIEVALKHTRGRKGEAADLLGWGRNTLTRKLKQLEEASNDTEKPTH